ncbi:arginase [Ferruginivarius sediminum]|uniref:Arginase n=1 Tax=Ferruginivarius sediminum TaxID=2661937 RepID=A0A369TDE7_9PROT|nr:arginase [Ferruginivarius sediminum]RDD63310.1 arginase [Ferruginivarius sediminum]
MNVTTAAQQHDKPGAAGTRTLGLIGAPSDVAAGCRGATMGPEALRVAGLGDVLAGLGYSVNDRGNLSGPVNPGGPRGNGYRHLAETTEWVRLVRDEVAASLAAKELPILMGGDHSLSIGSIGAAARHCHEAGKPLSVLWLDAHADFNTAETSPSGNIHGMPVAVLCGDGPEELLSLGHARPMLDPDHLVQVGVRSVDMVEKRMVVERRLRVFDMRTIDEIGMRAAMEEALEAVGRVGGHLHVSFDADFVDPSAAPGVGTPVPGGPNYREAQLCMEMIYDSGLLGSLDIVEVNPALDWRNSTAELAVDLVKSLFGERILARVL